MAVLDTLLEGFVFFRIEETEASLKKEERKIADVSLT